MPTPRGHGTDRPSKYTVHERELAKRKILHAEIADLSRPLIVHLAEPRGLAEALKPCAPTQAGRGARDIGICPYPGCKTLCVGRYCRTHRGASYSLTYLLTPAQRAATAFDIRRASTERNRLLPKKQRNVPTHPRWHVPRIPKGISKHYRPGDSLTRQSVAPSWLPGIMSRGSAMRDVKGALGARGFGYWRLMGGDARFCGKVGSEMNRDELLCAVGWLLSGYSVWKHAYLVRSDKKYKASYVPAGTVTKLMKDKPPQKTLWLACGTPPIIGAARDSRESQ